MKQARTGIIFLTLSILLLLTISYVPNFYTFIEKEGETYFEPTKEEVLEKTEEVTSIKNEYNNPDIMGSIRIPNTKIDEIVVQGKDNDYYLNYNEKREKDVRGAIFLDYRVELDSKKLLIYGHNSSDLDVPFKELENYYNKDYYTKHKYIELTTELGISTYEIFSVFIETEDWSYMNINFKDDDAWLEHILSLKNNSMYETGVSVSKGDEILILQTCSHHKDYKKYENKYFLVIGKKVNAN